MDIRLGDVVGSKPTATFDGVVQYDMGKVTVGGILQRTGRLSPVSSPLILLSFPPSHRTSSRSSLEPPAGPVKQRLAQMFAHSSRKSWIFMMTQQEHFETGIPVAV
jgi:hypothetical protein